MTMRTLLGAALAVGMIAVDSPPVAAQEARLHMDDAWSRPMESGGGSGAGYLSIRNDGDSDARLIAVEADRAGRAELHRTVVEDGVARMRPVTEGIAIPSGETVALEPGGLHIMFRDVAEPFVDGEHIEAVLVFEAAGEVPVRFRVGDGGADDTARGRHDH